MNISQPKIAIVLTLTSLVISLIAPSSLLASGDPDCLKVFRSDGLLAASCEMSTQQSLEK